MTALFTQLLRPQTFKSSWLSQTVINYISKFCAFCFQNMYRIWSSFTPSMLPLWSNPPPLLPSFNASTCLGTVLSTQWHQIMTLPVQNSPLASPFQWIKQTQVLLLVLPGPPPCSCQPSSGHSFTPTTLACFLHLQHTWLLPPQGFPCLDSSPRHSHGWLPRSTQVSAQIAHLTGLPLSGSKKSSAPPPGWPVYTWALNVTTTRAFFCPIQCCTLTSHNNN